MPASRCTFPVPEVEEVVSELKKAKQDNIMRRLEQAATYAIAVMESPISQKSLQRDRIDIWACPEYVESTF